MGQLQLLTASQHPVGLLNSAHISEMKAEQSPESVHNMTEILRPLVNDWWLPDMYQFGILLPPSGESGPVSIWLLLQECLKATPVKYRSRVVAEKSFSKVLRLPYEKWAINPLDHSNGPMAPAHSSSKVVSAHRVPCPLLQ